MSRTSRFVALFLSVAPPLAAQDVPTDTPRTNADRAGKVGIGMAVTTTTLLLGESFFFVPMGFNNFIVPIRTGPRTTFEPEFGMFRTSTSNGGFSSNFSNLRLGFGLLTAMDKRENLEPYIGPRVGTSRSKTTTTLPFSGEQTETQNSWYFSGVLGAQYFFSRHFSLGGEAQLSYTNLRQEADSAGSSASQSFVSSAGVVLLRWFF
jgi:hypothetical protein